MARIALLHQNLFGVGGTVSTVYNLANELAKNHAVTLVSVFRRVDEPMMTRAPSIRLVSLVDMRPEGKDRGDVRLNARSELVPPAEEYYRQYSALTDERIGEYLRNVKTDVVIGTRPSLNILLAQLGTGEYARIAQEHMSHASIPQTVRDAMQKTYRDGIDAAITVTDADARRFEIMTPVGGLLVTSIPNGVPVPTLPLLDISVPNILLVGRLAQEKRYDRVLRVFAPLSTEFPEWRLRVYGDGPLRASLQGLAVELGIENRVLFLGRSSNMSEEWGKGSIHVVSSERESFGMTLVEAMRAGLAVLSIDCPDGPREIILDGKDGVLAQSNGEDLEPQLAELMRSASKREELSGRAVVSGAKYDPSRIAERYQELFATMGVRRPSGEPLGRLRRLLGPLKGGRRAQRATRVAEAKLRMASDSQVEISTRGHFDRLVLVRRGAKDKVEVLPTGRGQEAIIFVPSLTDLETGNWNIYGQRGSRRTRLRPEVIDTRVIVNAHLGDPGSRVCCIPYPTLDGFAALRVFNFVRRFEVDRLDVSDEAIMLTGQLAGDSSAPGTPLSLAICEEGSGRRLAVSSPAATALQGRAVRLEMQLDALGDVALKHGEGSYSLVVLHGEEAVPVGFFHGDVSDRRKSQTFPAIRIEQEVDEELFREYPQSIYEVRPVINRENEVTLQVSRR